VAGQRPCWLLDVVPMKPLLALSVFVSAEDS